MKVFGDSRLVSKNRSFSMAELCRRVGVVDAIISVRGGFAKDIDKGVCREGVKTGDILGAYCGRGVRAIVLLPRLSSTIGVLLGLIDERLSFETAVPRRLLRLGLFDLRRRAPDRAAVFAG